MKIIYYAPKSLSLKKKIPLNLAPRRRTFFIKQALEKKAEVFTICGEIDERIELIEEFHKKHTFAEFDGMYIESTNWPLRFFDYTFFYKASRKMPITIFYRDCYWKFSDTIYNFSSVRKKLAIYRFKLEFIFYKKYTNTFFVPSKKFAKLLNLKNYILLPPGCIATNATKSNRLKSDVFNIVFSGSEKFGTAIIRDISSKLSKNGVNFHIYIFSSEFKTIKDKNISVIDDSLANRKDILEKSHIGINPQYPDKYYALTISLKLFDYTSYGLPVIFTNNEPMAQIIEINKIGFSIDFDADKFVEKIMLFKSNEELYKIYKENCFRFAERESWDSRAETILKTIRKLKKWEKS